MRQSLGPTKSQVLAPWLTPERCAPQEQMHLFYKYPVGHTTGLLVQPKNGFVCAAHYGLGHYGPCSVYANHYNDCYHLALPL